jgi:hypothetical protein
VSETLVKSVFKNCVTLLFSTLKRRALGFLTPRQPLDYLELMYKVKRHALDPKLFYDGTSPLNLFSTS